MYYYVYILESISQPQNYYVGCTANLKRRLERHNQGGSLHTSKYKPWRLTIAVSFTDKHKAYAFEKPFWKSIFKKAFLNNFAK